jgi:hypothetical protein
MRIQTLGIAILGLLGSGLAAAEIAKHTTVNMNSSGTVTEITEMVADDNGNLRIEIYAADASGDRGALDSFIVFQAAEQKMLTSAEGMCNTLSLDGENLPGGISREEMSAAQAEMQRALKEMQAQNPEMAKMLEAQMGTSMAAMMGGETPKIQVVQTGEERTIEGYDTQSFRVNGMPGVSNYTVWAADISDVEGGRTIARASQGMMQANKQMMENMGIAEMVGANAFNEILDAMDDYYPILSEDGSVTTRLVSTNGNGTADFNPTCNQ